MARFAKDFSSKAFWDSRFQQEEHFEWLAAADVLTDKVASALQQQDPLKARILHIGSGTSTLSNSLRTRLVPSLISNPRNIVNLDYSELAIERGRQLELQEFGSIEMSYTVADLLNYSSLEASLHKIFDMPLLVNLVVEKSCADAISCGPHITTQVTQPENIITVAPTVALALHLSRITKSGSKWIALSYSKYRFDFLNPDSDEFSKEASQLWKVVETHQVKPDISNETVKANVYQPEVFHTLFIVERLCDTTF
ncbi:hypothetical protein HDU99_003008 [Rhizoclosmatium hyalinum]|nr:hypothetical protein HDU99_003008 [Rhizoclosmatium hyalinum]